MTIYQWLCLLGFPSLITAFGAFIVGQVRQMKAVKLGLQALLRSQMITAYNSCMEKGFARIYEKENFENCWTQYEALGQNGVMSHLHDEFMALPTEPKRKVE